MKEEYIVNLKGKSYPTYPGILDEAHQKGLTSIETELVQAPTKENDAVAIVRATVKLGDKVFTDYGDASPRNVNSFIATALIRMASTRAKGRALRDAVNVGETMLEEITLQEVENEKTPKNNASKPQTHNSALSTSTTLKSQNFNDKPYTVNDIPQDISLKELIDHSTDQCTHKYKPFVKTCSHQINDMDLHNITVQCPGCNDMAKLVYGINSQQKPYVATRCDNKHWYQANSKEFLSALKSMPKLFSAVQEYMKTADPYAGLTPE